MPFAIDNTTYLTMGDAAFAENLFGTSFDCVAGYLHSGFEFHAWADSDWDPIPGPKLPIWVYGGNPVKDAESCLSQLTALGVPTGMTVALDMETFVDVAYVAAFGAVLNHRGYNVWVYGSASTVFGNPKLQGYWVADYLFTPFMYSHIGVRATQWTDGPKYDQSLVKEWEAENLWH